MGGKRMQEVLRQERKFLITTEEYYRLSDILSNVMNEDSHNGLDGYQIRSLYFDSLDDRDYEEKEDGVECRRKIRLRTYDPKSSFAVLEMKQKQGSNQKKRSLRLNREDAMEVMRGNLSVLLKYPDPFARECFGYMQMHVYRPKTIVEYTRRAFIAKENNIRITFDHHIIGTEHNLNIFDENLSQYPLFDSYMVILEVKYNHFLLSYLKDVINMTDKSELSISKYALARSVSKHYRY